MINILICDDDEAIVTQVSKLVETWGKAHNVGFWINKKTTGDFIFEEKYSYDIAFIDIEMPGISGLKLSEELQKLNPDILVFVITSFQSYLDAAMKIHVFRYLSKPIDTNRFNNNLSDAIEEYRKLSRSIVVDLKDEVYYINTKDILFIENLKYGSKIITKTDEYITSVKPMEWYKKIDLPNCFVFSHTSFLINLQNVIDFNKTTITLRKNSKEVVTAYMSQRKYYNFKKAFIAFAARTKNKI